MSDRKETTMTTTGLQVIAFTAIVSVAYGVYQWWQSRKNKSTREERTAMQTWEGEGGNIVDETRPSQPGGPTVHPT
jgi:uncharacterized protein HemX